MLHGVVFAQRRRKRMWPTGVDEVGYGIIQTLKIVILQRRTEDGVEINIVDESAFLEQVN